MTNDHPASHRPGKEVSVIIPTHNRPALLQEALASALGQAVLPAEILIVDDASDPPVVLPADNNGVPLHLLRHEQQRGGAAAKNTEAQATQGGGIAFLDDAMRRAGGAVRRMIHNTRARMNFGLPPQLDDLIARMGNMGKCEQSRGHANLHAIL